MNIRKTSIAFVIAALSAAPLWAHGPGKDVAKGIHSNTQQPTESIDSAFDLVHTHVFKDGKDLVFEQLVDGKAGSRIPTAKGKFPGAEVYSYVWPTSLDSSAVGFEKASGILALALTSHPDFDDTPQLDENKDGKKDNDGGLWHSHWVVLVKDASCGPSGLKVRDIPEGAKPKLPATWPGAAIYIDSPGYTLQDVYKRQALGNAIINMTLRTGSEWNGVAAVSYTHLFAVDGKLSYELPSGVRLMANAGVGYDAINDDAAITASYAGAPGASFGTDGIEPDPWLVRGGLGIAASPASDVEISVRYDVETRDDFINETASIKVRWNF